MKKNYIVESLYEKYGGLSETPKKLNESVEKGSDTMLDDAYKGSWYTIEGAGGDLSEWENGYSDMLEEQGIGRPSRFIAFTGKQVSDHFDFRGNNRYPDDLTILCFPLDGLNISKLAIFKIKMRDRWFDDIVDNTRYHQGEFDESLKEAVNHENDEINEIIRRNLGKKPNRISKADMKALTDAGIKVIDDVTMEGPNGRTIKRYGRSETYGPMHTVDKRSWNKSGRQTNQWDTSSKAKRKGWNSAEGVENFNKVDLKGYLDKPERRNVYSDNVDMHHTLRPWSDDYKTQKEEASWNQRMANRYAKDIRSEEDIEAEVNKLRNKLNKDNEYYISTKKEYDDAAEDARKSIEDIKARAKANREARRNKNESLSLKEDLEEARKVYFSCNPSNTFSNEDVQQIILSILEAIVPNRYLDLRPVMLHLLDNEFCYAVVASDKELTEIEQRLSTLPEALIKKIDFLPF